MFTLNHRLSMATIAAAMLISTGAHAYDAKAEGSAWRDQNCMFRSGVIQKGGDATRTSIYKSNESVKYQWCSPTTRTQVSSNDRDAYYIDSRGNRVYYNSNLAPAAGY